MAWMGDNICQVDALPWGWTRYAAAAAVALLIYICADALNRRSRRLPPGPRGWPIVGSLLELGPNPHHTFTRMAAKYGPLMSLRLGTQLTVVASSPAMAEQILKKHDHVFAGRTVTHAAEANKYVHAEVSVLQLGQRWRTIRKVANTQLFTAKKLDTLQPLRAEQLDRTVRHVAAASAAGSEIEIRRVAFGCTVNLMATTLFGAEIFDRGSEELREFQATVMEVMQTLGQPNMSDFFPALRPLDLQGVRHRADTAFGKLDSQLEPLLRKRVAEPQEQAAERRDLLAALLDSRGPEFGIDDVAGFISAMFVAGTDTVTLTTEWAMAELMRNPDVMAKCHAEMDRVVGRERPVVEADAERLPFLNAVIKETFRLHPPGPLLIPHRASQDAEVAGYFVPKNARILVNVWAIGRDPSIWDDSEKFDPERFLRKPELDYRGQHYEFLPFGSGRRICVGLPLGRLMVFLLVASLVQAFRWSLPGTMSPSDLDMKERFGLAVGKHVPLRILALPRLPFHLIN